MGLGSAAAQMLIANFLLILGRQPTLNEINEELRLINELGFYPSRARLSLTSSLRGEAEAISGIASSASGLLAMTVVGVLDASLVQTHGITDSEITEANARAAVIASEAKQSQAAEALLETKHLETLARKTFRSLLGRDPNEAAGTVPAVILSPQGEGSQSGDSSAPALSEAEGSPQNDPRVLAALAACTPQANCTELSFITELLRAFGSQSAFEDYLKTGYNVVDGKSEHERRTGEITAIINQVETLLREYMGGMLNASQDALHASLAEILKLLKSDPSFSISDLTETDLAKLMARLRSLVEEDLHFGSSAVWALYEMLTRHTPSPLAGEGGDGGTNPPPLSSPTREEEMRLLTVLLLFTDILTGVVSPEFVGNLQFSAYALITVAQAVTSGNVILSPEGEESQTGDPSATPQDDNRLKLVGVRISWEELLALVSAGNHVLVSIEDRHFVVVTGIQGADCAVIPAQAGIQSACFVTFLENGFIRTISAQEFTARWFGVALVDQASLRDADPSSVIASDSEAISSYWKPKLLKTSDLLKIKGAGWWKRLWKKIKKFFQAVARAIVKVVKKVVQAVQKFLSTVAGKIIGTLLLGPIGFALLNFGINSASYVLNGDFKGLMKYWGQAAIQIGIQLAMAALYLIPGVGQVLGTAFQMLGNFLQAVGGFLAAAGSLLASAIPIAGPLLGGILQAGGALLSHVGGALIQYGANLKAQANSFFQDLKARGFEAVKDNFRNPFDLKPKISYRDALPSNVRITYTPSSSEVFLNLVEDQARVPIPGVEKSAVDLLVKAILDTAISAAVGAIQNQVEQLFSSRPTTPQFNRPPPELEARGLNAPRPNMPYFDGNTLTNPTTGKPWMSLNGNYAFAYDEKGIPTRYQSQEEPYPQGLEQLDPNHYRNIQDDGKLDYFERDSRTGEMTPQSFGPSRSEFRSTIPQISRPASGFRNVLDQEFTTRDIETSLVNLRAAFSNHRVLSNNTFFHNLGESLTVRGQDILFGRLIDGATRGSKVAKFFLDATGLKGKIQEGFLPGRQLTNWGREQISGVFQKFLGFVNEDKFRILNYEHAAERFLPSLVGRALDAGFKNAPIYGDLIRILNINAPRAGDLIHTIRFVTQDFSGFFRQGELTFIYGPFVDQFGHQHVGVIQASFRLRSSRFRNRPRFEPTFDESDYVPWL